MRRRLECAVFGLLLPLGVAAGWVMDPLGQPPAGYSVAAVTDINDRGQVVGTIRSDDWYEFAFVWEDGNWTILPTLGGRSAYATGINNRGQVVGFSVTDDLVCGEYEGEQYCNPLVRGFLWEDGQIKELGPAGFDSFAAGINDAGTVAGVYSDASEWNAVLWDAAGRVTLMGSSPAPSVFPAGINSRGQVVGIPSNCADLHARMWDRRRGLIDLGTLGGPSSVALSINDWGKVVGSSETDEVLSCETDEGGTSCTYASAPVVWEDGVATPLPVLGGNQTVAQAADVNNDGVIAGTTDTDELIECSEEDGHTHCDYRFHAVVWVDGELTDLGQAGKSSGANAINNSWEIAGWAEGVGPVIWRPVEPVE